MLTLRPYQTEALDAIHTAHQRGIQRPLIVLPTGAGKTVVFSHLAERRRRVGRTLVIAHREELLAQAADKLRMVNPDLEVGVVKAERDDHQAADVVVASIQTIANPRRHAPLVGTVATIVVDEAHHATARTYRETLDVLGAMSDGGPLTVGVTATAGRADGAGLGHIWQEIVYQRGIIHMIADGYLVDVEGKQLTTDLDFGKVKTSHGDYTDASLGAQLEADGAVEAAAYGYAKYAKNLRGIAFTPTVATAEHLAAELTRRGIRAEHLSGQTPSTERTAILHRLRAGETQVVANCAVLTEGFDEPSLQCALIVRPTKSRTLFTQMAGRILRPYPGKDKALILTLYGPPDAGLATLADLSGADPAKMPTVRDGETLAEAVARDEEDRNRTLNGRRVTSVVTAKTIELFARSQLRWLPAGPGFILSCGQADILLVPHGDRWDVVEQAGRKRSTLSTELQLEWAQGVGEEYVRAHQARTIIASSDAGWRKKAPSEAQTAQLRKLGLDIPATRGEASDALTAAWGARDMARAVKAS